MCGICMFLWVCLYMYVEAKVEIESSLITPHIIFEALSLTDLGAHQLAKLDSQ